MAHELFYTSAERGLDPGAIGFCTVKRTRGLSKRLERLLHDLSVYKALYPPHDPRFANNPVVFMHCKANVDGQTVAILSRICAAPLDYSGRSNYFAHHIVLHPSECPPAGPAWLLKQSSLFATSWDGQVAELPNARPIPRGDSPPRRCTTWERVTGDAGWAGVVLKYLAENPSIPFYLIVNETMPALDLLEEVIALLPMEKRWSVTFSVPYIHIPTGVTCAGRVVPAHSEKIAEAKASPRCLDLTSLRTRRPPDDPYTKAARSGEFARISEQGIRAEDEPVLPFSSEAFSRVQVAGPIRHDPPLPLGSSPRTIGTPPPPPGGLNTVQSSHVPLWIVVVTCVQFILLALLAGAQFMTYRRMNDSLTQLSTANDQLAKKHHNEISTLREEVEKNAKETTNRLETALAGVEKKMHAELGKLSEKIEGLEAGFDEIKKKDLASAGTAIKKLSEQLKDQQKELIEASKKLRDIREEMTVKLETMIKGAGLAEDKELAFSGKLEKEKLEGAIAIHCSHRGRSLRPVVSKSLQFQGEDFLLEVKRDDKQQSFTGELELKTKLLSSKDDKKREDGHNRLKGLVLLIVDGNYKLWIVHLEVVQPKRIADKTSQ